MHTNMDGIEFYRLKIHQQVVLLEKARLLVTTTGGRGNGYFFALYQLDELFILGVCQHEQAFADRQFLQLIAQNVLTVLDQITGGLYTSIKPDQHG